jgi:hypothetical protein
VIAFVERVGRAGVAPRRALEATDRGEGGAGDALALLLLKLVCGELRFFVAAAWALVVAGPGPAFSIFAARVSQVVGIDIIVTLVAGIVITLAAGRRRSPARDFELACTAWIPLLVVDLIASLVVAVFDLDLGPAAVWAIWAVALVWTAGVSYAAVRVARERTL